MNRFSHVAAHVVITFILTRPVVAQLVNAGFETGNLTGWTESGGVTVQSSAPGVSPTEGSYFAMLHATNGASLSLKQSFVANAGDILRFDLGVVVQGGPSSGSSGVWNLDNGMIAESLDPIAGPDPWSHRSWRLPIAGTYEVRFQASATGDAVFDLFVDNFRLVPEPASAVLLLFGVAVALGRHRSET